MFRGRVTTGAAGVAMVVIFAATGCAAPQIWDSATGADASSAPGRTSSSEGAATPSASPSDTRPPVADAGGACKLLRHSAVDSTTGVAFDVAASDKHGKTRSCVLQVTGHAYPDLTLTISPTKADAEVFENTVTPGHAEEVSGLGKAGYRAVNAAEGQGGPVAQVGWLADGSILTLRYTYESGASQGQAEHMADNLVKLGKKVASGS